MKAIDMHRLQELVRLHRMNEPFTEIARMLGISPMTERFYRRILLEANLLKGDPKDLPSGEVLDEAIKKANPKDSDVKWVSSVDKWADQIAAMVKTRATPKAIFDRLKLDDADFCGSISAVKRKCNTLKKELGIKPTDVVIPVSTTPGDVAQVDFGYVGKLYDSAQKCLRKAWVFVMVLGYSRHMVCRIVFDQKVETWLRLHEEAFIELGGVIATVVPDNLKSAVIRAAFAPTEETTLNRSYREAARHFGFKIDPTPVRSPEKKEKLSRVSSM